MLKVFVDQELPLLLEREYLSDIAEFRNIADFRNTSNSLVAQPGGARVSLENTNDYEKKALGGIWTHDLRSSPPVFTKTRAEDYETFSIIDRDGLSVVNPSSIIRKEGAEYTAPLFKDWLQAQHKTKWTIREIIIYAKKYGAIFDTGDASPLLVLSARNRHHAMSALASWSKYKGKYQVWREIVNQYSLKWASGNESLHAMERFFNPELNLSDMIDKVKEMIHVLPLAMATVVKHAALTGLRPTEACESVRLLNNDDDVQAIGQQRRYYNRDPNAGTF